MIFSQFLERDFCKSKFKLSYELFVLYNCENQETLGEKANKSPNLPPSPANRNFPFTVFNRAI